MSILMEAPAVWPFNSPVIPASRMPSGKSYRPDGNGQISADALDVGALLGFGFTIETSPTVRVVSGITDTILASDFGNAISYTNGSAIAVSVPSLGAGFTCLLLQIGAGAFTVTGDGVTVENRQSQLASAGQNAQCSLFFDTATHAIFGGDTA